MYSANPFYPFPTSSLRDIMVGQWIYLNHNSKGDNELTLQDIEKPKLTSPTDVLVRIRAVSLNYRDVSSASCALLIIDHDQRRNVHFASQGR
jgi:hypothetical protein